MIQERTINIQWITEESDAESVRHAMEAAGRVASAEPWEPDADTLEEFGDSQLEPMMVIAGVIAGGWLIKRVSDVLLDWIRPGGMLIDATGEELVVRPAPRARRGALVLLTQKGIQPHVFLPQERDQALKELARIVGVSNG
jgi:hypothetical protein